ncbi:MAG: hypothetical protein Q8R28_24140 [Dehalococcoidia bacterium]|nr:hypothetical protein [Dehalococcoidia bacterium]
MSAGRPIEVLWQLTGSDVISLAINVVQNGFDYRELRPDLAFLVGGSATKPRGRGQSGDGPASDGIRMMLEEVYREILRANAQHMGPNGSLPPAHCGPLPPSPGYSSDERD